LVLALFSAISLIEGIGSFAREIPLERLQSVRELYYPFRLVNTYHLFAQITRERIEPEFQTFDGANWTARDFHYKPGDVYRAPRTVAPHQPRVDFQLWFYGLDYSRHTPAYVVTLLDRLCNDPGAVQRLFRAPLQAHPQAVRLVFWQYHFTTPVERRQSGAWWRRTQRDQSRAIPCRAP
jgi:hypothetical protein